jgi:hypothetical protein
VVVTSNHQKQDHVVYIMMRMNTCTHHQHHRKHQQFVHCYIVLMIFHPTLHLHQQHCPHHHRHQVRDSILKLTEVCSLYCNASSQHIDIATFVVLCNNMTQMFRNMCNCMWSMIKSVIVSVVQIHQT